MGMRSCAERSMTAHDITTAGDTPRTREKGALSPGVSPRVAARMAYVASALNTFAALALLVILRPGLPNGGAGPEQLAYVAGHLGQWWAGWLVWHAAALGLLAFYVGLAGLWWRRAPVRCVLALLCSSSGLAADLTAEAIYMGLGPRISPEGFALAQDVAGLLTGY